MLFKRLRQGVLFSAMTLAAAAPVSAVASENDPWEGYNRAMFSFNETVDKYALKPVAQGYRFVMPDMAEKGVSNFFGNLGDIRSAVNSALQGKGDDALTSVARIVFNSTFGLAGLIDVATPMGLEKQREGFGQTLAVWGVDSGPYVVLPFLGSSTVRDGFGLVPDWYLTPVTYVDDVPTRNTLYGLALIDARAQLLQAEQIVSGDKYIFVRDAYLQRREYLIHDGNIPVQYDDNDF
ncbi:MlaA family lipoprotein [Marinobacterium mangrovicola]|uniref:Phospholipid-binding lipoprotein MlaA n=1 Tax=Marinobacterium mangrovicola TaxID=1476959 RepID=A0A4V2PEC0_9GAMM|nr:VacJ family lipoprotein [Marinobacterium mangrovicola]TCK08566.1 phospholipid-binding lipoprotein MlaA [Marinobacterium mangrovicola]